MPPAYRTGGVKQEFGDPGDVTVILASIRDQQIIAADHLGFAVGKQGKREVALAIQFARFVVGVCTDGNRFDARGLQSSQVALYPP